MKKLFFALCLSFFLQTIHAQAFQKDSKMINAGLGFGWSYYHGSYDNVSSFPNIEVSYEQGIYELEDVGPISVGGILGFSHSQRDFNSGAISINQKWNDIYAAARGKLYLNEILDNPKFDLYAGLSLGLRYINYKVSDNYNDPDRPNDLNLMLNVFGGVRYFITDQVAIYGEVGYGIAYLTIGATFKL